MSHRFTKSQLHQMIVNDLGDRVVWHSDVSEKTLLIDLQNPNHKLRIYIFNCTCPPGGRTLDEYKIQMIIEGQKRGNRGQLDDLDGRLVFVMGLAQPFVNPTDGVYIMWDPLFHHDFAYSANLQCYLDPMLQALTEDVVECRKKGNKEMIVVSLRENIGKAIEKRIALNTKSLLELDV